MLGLASFTYGLMSAIAGEIPKLDETRRQGVQKDGFIYASDGKTVLAVLRGTESRILVSSRQIAPTIKHAIVAVEDKRFFDHSGIDVRGIFRAAWADLRHQKVVEGGSTITQQFIKNAYVERSRSIARKLKEALLARQLEQRWSKERILTAYLNTIYFGNGAYGIQRAAKTYFGHGASKLTWAEAALLAGIPADPSRYDPVASPAEARRRRELVLRKLYEQGTITLSQRAAANRAALPRPDRVHLPVAVGQAQYFTNYVKQQLVDRYGSGRVFGGGMRVVTSIDFGLQEIARESISEWLPDADGPSAALVAIDPRDGRVLAMIGGRSFRESQFNLAVQGERQPGSAFKPFVLAAALEQGISPETTFDSEPVTIPYDGKLWAVRNYENSYLGRIDLATATIASDNAVYAQLTHVVSPREVSRTARKLGVTSPLDDYLAIGLGGEAVNPLEMARGFASFANGGRRVDGSRTGDRPRAVLSINGKENEPKPVEVMSANNAAVLNGILQRVVTGGTGTRAQLADGRPVAGKTGTTENYGDAWFVGYTPQLAVAVWVGYPDTLRPMLTEYYGRPVAGGTFPARIWKTFAERALAHLREEPASFPGAEYVSAEPRRLALRREGWAFDNTGHCRNTIEVAYFTDREPLRQANCKPNEVDVPRVVGKPLELAEQRLRAQPLTPVLIYKPAAPRQRLGIVLRQFPAGGTLSSFDEVKLVLAKPLHGVVPGLVGLPLGTARQRLRRLHLRPRVRMLERVLDPDAARVVSQAPGPGVAAAPGMPVRLAVRDEAPAG
ncbi:MAG: PBP1A family penicillin-binding protein [Gaiellaceae bacterium]